MARQVRAALPALSAALGLALLGCGPKPAAPAAESVAQKAQEIGSLGVSQAVVRPGAAGANTAAYLLLVNHAANTDRLLSASSPIAGRVEIHEHIKTDTGLVAMRRVDAPLALQGQGQLAFEPSGLHLMAFDLNRPLVSGETVPITLNFEQAGPVEVLFEVGIPRRPAADTHTEHEQQEHQEHQEHHER